MPGPVLEPPPNERIQTVLLQQPALPAGPAEQSGYQIQLEPPSRDRLFRLESEASLAERLRQENIDKGEPGGRLEFPEEPPLTTEKYLVRDWPTRSIIAEPNYVCYGRMYFEDKNSERYGWDLGFIQPFVSAGRFYWDLATLPYHFGSDPCRMCECSAGYCLPGDPVPYLCYPPELSVTGTLAEAAVIGGLVVTFP
jgi:hypothetical protein